jgi:hypothetical protein
MLTKNKTRANIEFFENMAKITKVWIHQDTLIRYEIVNNKYILDTPEKLFELCKLSSLEWVMRNTDFSVVSNDERYRIFYFFTKERGW